MACVVSNCKRFKKHDPEQLEQFRANNPSTRERGNIDKSTGLRQVLKRPPIDQNKSVASCQPKIPSPLEYYVRVTNDRADTFSSALFSRGNLNTIQRLLLMEVKKETGLDISPQDEQPMMDILINVYYEYFTDRYNFSLNPAQAPEDDMGAMIAEINWRAVQLMKREVYVGMRSYLYAKTAPLNSDHMIPVGLRGHYGVDSRKEFKDERSLVLDGTFDMTKIAPRLSIFTRQTM